MTSYFADRFGVPLSRRQWLGVSLAGAASSAWLPTLAAGTENDPQRRRRCILLWMSGGPSQTDTFDLKPGHPNGGPFEEIDTSVPGIRFSQHLPLLAKQAQDLVLVRSMSTNEGDHGRATFHLRTGYRPTGPIQYPAFGSLLSKELGRDEDELPSFVSIYPYRGANSAAFGSGFLGPMFAPLTVGERAGSAQGNYDELLKVRNLEAPGGVRLGQSGTRADLLAGNDEQFLADRPGLPGESHRTAYSRAKRFMQSAAGKVFNLDDEPAEVREAYGLNAFGQGCLLARRLVENGVSFVEVSIGGAAWDTHAANFDSVQQLSGLLDPAWATLMEDLRSRGLLESTLIVWMGEFGRTPQINGGNGRDHYPAAWSTVLAGGGVRGGQTIGRTSRDGMTVEDRPVAVADLLATVCRALGIDPKKQNMSNVGRPIRIADPAAAAIEEALA